MRDNYFENGYFINTNFFLWKSLRKNISVSYRSPSPRFGSESGGAKSGVYGNN